MTKAKRVLFIVQYPKGISPSQRFRIELYERVLKENNIQFDYDLFIDEASRKILYRHGMALQKIWGVLKGFARRVTRLFTLHQYDFIFIQREASPVGPPVFEWLYSKVFSKKVIFDFDDALWAHPLEYHNKWVKFFKFFGKIKHTCKWSYKVSAGNRYLCEFAARYNDNVILNPTCVDTEYQHNTIKETTKGKVTIGWTGSFSTLYYLEFITGVLHQLEQKYDFDFVVIADRNPHLPLKGFKFIHWNKETEIEDLAQCDIGIMPLTQIAHAEGKCGFKIIQFMALGIPVVATPIGVNVEITGENKGGFLCSTPDEWVTALERLITDEQLRMKMGKDGRVQIESNYSVKSNAENFLSLFK